jgi:hypothetical protein
MIQLTLALLGPMSDPDRKLRHLLLRSLFCPILNLVFSIKKNPLDVLSPLEDKNNNIFGKSTSYSKITWRVAFSSYDSKFPKIFHVIVSCKVNITEEIQWGSV